jgi:hypothetical protein
MLAQLLTVYGGQLQLLPYLACLYLHACVQQKTSQSTHRFNKNHSTYLVCQNIKEEKGNGIFFGTIYNGFFFPKYNTDADARKRLSFRF